MDKWKFPGKFFLGKFPRNPEIVEFSKNGNTRRKVK